MKMAAAFLFLYSVILTLAPAARERTWAVTLNWSHWLGFAAWALIFSLAHLLLRWRLPDSDPYLLPLAGLLTGWGMLTIWRLDPGFGAGQAVSFFRLGYGFRQTMWLLLSGVVLLAGLWISPELRFVRRYKYIWLTGGLLLTALTLVFGTNPTGGNERLWLGCCGVYFQPSEPLKLLLIVYLAAYFADLVPLTLRLLPLLIPGATITAVATLLLLAQHDLGTASIFIFLFTITLFLASGKKRVLVVSLLGMAIATVAGYFLFDVVRLRVDAWLNPWLDPSGRSYQIVQSLLAIANGGTTGRGPGLGSPGLVPVAISDFIFSAIAEETGLVGTLGLLAAVGFLAARGIRIALRAPDNFRRILAGGVTVYLGAQSILIIGGNMRLLPLTGVTLPFVSYGGSSLLTSFLALLLLLLISSTSEAEPAPLRNPQPYTLLAALLGIGLSILALADGWWAIWRGPDLLTRTDNARRAIADRYVKRGSLLDRSEVLVNTTVGVSGTYMRQYLYPDLSPIVGYTSPVYGQAGLEASLDPYLRGLQGNPASLIWIDHLLYGEPPPGLDVRLSLDLELQRRADALLGSHSGAVVLLNAKTGEILAMASHPTFDANLMDTQGTQLSQNPQKPLLDRAAQGMYPVGNGLIPFYQAAGLNAVSPRSSVDVLFAHLGFYTTPNFRLPVAPATSSQDNLRLSPLQMALATAALSNAGLVPPPRLAMAVNTPAQGWVVLPALSQPVQALPASGVASVTKTLLVRGQPFWDTTGKGSDNQVTVTWYLAGTMPEWQAAPIALVVVLEEDNPDLITSLGEALMQAALSP